MSQTIWPSLVFQGGLAQAALKFFASPLTDNSSLEFARHGLGDLACVA